MQGIKLSLIFTLYIAVFCGFSGFLRAETAVKAVPPVEVSAEPLEPAGPQGLVVLELFSSQACVFCPDADAMLDELSAHENVIALACHVDYFDVRKNSLPHAFCSERQGRYAEALRSGPKYTPQLVVNGQYEVVGYKKERVDRALGKAAARNIPRLEITAVDKGKFTLKMPALPKGDYGLWIAVRDKPIDLKIAEGLNAGKNKTYKNIVSNLAMPLEWDGAPKIMNLEVTLGDKQNGFAVMAQNKVTAEIVAAGLYQKP
jgi:hypothetical protein